MKLKIIVIFSLPLIKAQMRLINNNNNQYFISGNSLYEYKKTYKTHIIKKLKIIRTNVNQENM